MDKKTRGKGQLWLQVTSILLGVLGLVAYAVSKFASGKLVVIITGVGMLGFFIFPRFFGN